MGYDEIPANKGLIMDIQIPYYKHYAELITSNDMIIKSLGELSKTQGLSRARRSHDDFELLKVLSWGIKIVLEQNVSVLRALEKADEEYVDSLNHKLKEI